MGAQKEMAMGREMAAPRKPRKAIVVRDQVAGRAGVTLVERPEPQAAINDVVVQIHGETDLCGSARKGNAGSFRVSASRTPLRMTISWEAKGRWPKAAI